MTLYRLTLRLTAPLGTPLASPTVFGQLCWVKHEAEGEAALEDWLAQPQRLWRVSDGFPHDFLPKPLCRPRVQTAAPPEDHKKRKKRTLVRRKTWLAHQGHWNEYAVATDDFRKDAALPRRTAHNVIDRQGRGTLDKGGLFFLEEDWRFALEKEKGEASPDLVDIYVETDDGGEAVKGLFARLGAAGYGRDASTGRGRWVVESIEEEKDLLKGQGDRRMSLSRGVLTPETMRDALWKLEPHFGRAGPQIALCGYSPFKKPVLLTRPGTSFRPEGSGPCGRWLTGIHPERPEIGLNGFHVTIPFAEAPLEATI